MKKNIDKTMVVKAVISKIKDEGKPDKIKAKDLKDYKTPSKILYKEKNSHIIPDLAVYNDDGLYLYEVELDDKMDIEKWKIMSLYSKKYKGFLYLVVPDHLREKVKNELQKNQVNAGLIYFAMN